MPFNDDDKKEIAEIVKASLGDGLNETINKAITARNKDVEKKLDKALAEAFTAFAPKLDEIVTAKLEEGKKAGGEGGGEQKDPKAILDHPEFKGLQKQLADLKKESEAAKAETAAERAKVRDATLRQKLGEGLGSIGIADNFRVSKAIGDLVDSSKRVRWADEGDGIVFRDSDGSEVDLATGLKGWAKTDEGKFYLPPRGTTGSGATSGGRSPGTGDGSKALQKGDLGRMLMRAAGEAPGSD